MLEQTKDQRIVTPSALTGLNGAGSEGIAPQSRAEKRLEARYPCSDPCRVRILSADCGLFNATVVDISRSGLRIQVQSPIARGQDVQITLESKAWIFGEVRHCQRFGEEFYAGVHIKDVTFAIRSDIRRHVSDAQLLLFVARKGLAAGQVMVIRDHLFHCQQCAKRYAAGIKLHDRLRARTRESGS